LNTEEQSTEENENVEETAAQDNKELSYNSLYRGIGSKNFYFQRKLGFREI
jgi:hypothetical protein